MNFRILCFGHFAHTGSNLLKRKVFLLKIPQVAGLYCSPTGIRTRISGSGDLRSIRLTMGLVKSHKSTVKNWVVQKRKGFRVIPSAQEHGRKRN